MNDTIETRVALLELLSETVEEAADFLAEMDECFFDGYQTAREVLSHFVYWHREYVGIACALVNGCEPELRKGTFARLNRKAAREFAHLSMPDLADRFVDLQEELAALVRQLPDWGINFPVKWGSRQATVDKRLCTIEAHIQMHLTRMERAERHGKAWVDAYFREAV